MESNSVIHVIGAQCRPEVEKKLNKWLGEVHFPMLLKFEGLRRISHYQITKADNKYPNYLTIFEFDNQQAFEAYERSSELAEARKDHRETWPDGTGEIKWRVQYKRLGTWQKGSG